MTRIMKVIDYDFNWPKMFDAESKLLRVALGDNCLNVYHIGSTAVLGLVAKPIIDIIISVQEISKVNQDNLREIGYIVHGEMGMPFRLFCNKGEPRTYHLHIWEENNPEIQKHLLFIEFLKSHPDYLKRYADLKLELSKNYRTEEKNYTESKDRLIKEIIEKSGFNGLTIVQVNLPKEKEEYKRIMRVTPNESKDDVYFVLMQGANITGASHVKTGNQAKILSIKCDTTGQKNHFQTVLNRWLFC